MQLNELKHDTFGGLNLLILELIYSLNLCLCHVYQNLISFIDLLLYYTQLATNSPSVYKKQ